MDASCGPSNALSQLSKHTQRDQSLQNEFVGRQKNLQQNSFRSHGGIDANLNQDFHRFNSEGMGWFEPQFATHRPQFQNQASQEMGNVGQKYSWVQDFNDLSLKDRQQSHHHHHHQVVQKMAQDQKPDWHQQFMRQQNLQQNQQQPLLHQSSPALMSYQNQEYRPMGMGFGDQQFRQYTQQQPQDHMMEVLSSIEYEPTNFDDHFEQLEREMFEAEQAAGQALTSEVENEYEKEQFAEAARQVKKSMISEKNLASEETSSKFHQSHFLKLMSLISERQVELSKEGDKLVEKNSGADIRAHLSDPLKHEKEAQPDYHQPLHLETFGSLQPVLAPPQITRESETIRSHLPDPLAHIKDGSLPDNLTPLQAARIISGGQVTASDWTEDESWTTTSMPLRRQDILPQEWQEVYDDYRNEDDFH